MYIACACHILSQSHSFVPYLSASSSKTLVVAWSEAKESHPIMEVNPCHSFPALLDTWNIPIRFPLTTISHKWIKAVCLACKAPVYDFWERARAQHDPGSYKPGKFPHGDTWHYKACLYLTSKSNTRDIHNFKQISWYSYLVYISILKHAQDICVINARQALLSKNISLLVKINIPHKLYFILTPGMPKHKVCF